MNVKNIPQYLYRFITNPKVRFSYLTVLGLTHWMPDVQFLKK